MPLAITAIYASFLGLFFVVLAIPVIKLRRGLGVGLGDGGKGALQQAVRAHGNASEVIPLFLILLAIYELNRGMPLVMHVFGVVFLLARLSHAAGIYTSAGSSAGRIAGTIGSFGCVIGLALANLWKVFS